MLPMNLAISLAEATYEEQLEEQREVLLARRYHEGDQDVYLNDRAQEFLGLHGENPFRLNICRGVVNAVLDELQVVGFDTGEQGDTKPLAEWAMKVWNTNRMDAIQKDVHETALRDRESFVIVDWDTKNDRPRFSWHQRYTSLSAHEDGDEAGCYMVYPDNDYTQQPTAAVKRWMEDVWQGNIRTQRMRMTVYYPGRIERYAYTSGWQTYTDNEGDQWPTPWVDQTGRPLGIPVIHFKNAGLRPEAWDAIPMQDAINKMLVDILASGDLTAFRIFFASGFIPTTDGMPPKTDGSNQLSIAPAQIVGTTKDGASFTAIDGANLQPMVETLTQLILYTAMITDTPASRFSSSHQVQSGESQKEQNKPLLAKVETRRTMFGNAWEDALAFARKLENLFGAGRLDEETPFSTLWKHSYSLEELEAKKRLGVPQEQIWKEMGYSQADIKAMKESDEYRMKQETAQVSLETARSGARGNFGRVTSGG